MEIQQACILIFSLFLADELIAQETARDKDLHQQVGELAVLVNALRQELAEIRA